MIKPTTLAACLATIALAVPAGWHVLDADIQTDGPKLSPGVQAARIDDATISVQVDRGVVASGGTLSAILVATSDRPHPVTVDMTTFEDLGMGAERVPNPPLEVDRRKVVLQAQPGGGPPVVASVELGSAREERGVARWYDVYVTRHGASRTNETDPETVAHAGIATWSGNLFAVAIEPPASIPAEGPFTIALRVKNTTKAPFRFINPLVGGRLAAWNGMEDNFEIGTDDYDLAQIDVGAETDDDRGLVSGAERLFVYRVTPKRPGISHFTFVAHVTADGGGAMDIASIDRPTPEPAAEPATPSLAAR